MKRTLHEFSPKSELLFLTPTRSKVNSENAMLYALSRFIHHGLNKLEDSILDRPEFIKDRLKAKYKAHLASPAWYEEEISEISGNLLSGIRRFILISAVAEQRT